MEGKGLNMSGVTLFTAKIPLGARVKDRLTSMEGVVVGRSEYLYGCVQTLVNTGAVKDGKPVEGVWLDEDRLEVIGQPFSRSENADSRRGSDTEAPTGRSDHAPTR